MERLIAYFISRNCLYHDAVVMNIACEKNHNLGLHTDFYKQATYEASHHARGMPRQYGRKCSPQTLNPSRVSRQRAAVLPPSMSCANRVRRAHRPSSILWGVSYRLYCSHHTHRIAIVLTLAIQLNTRLLVRLYSACQQHPLHRQG